MDTFGRLPTDLLNIIKNLYETPVFDVHSTVIHNDIDYKMEDIYLTLKINSVVIRFFIIRIYRNSKEMGVITRYDELFDDIQNIITNLENDEPFTKEIEEIQFLLDDKFLVVSYHGVDVTFQNTIEIRKSLINELNKIISLIENFIYDVIIR